MKKILDLFIEYFAYLAIKREAESGRDEPVIVPFCEHTNPLLMFVQWFIMGVGIKRFYGWIHVLRFLLPAFVFMTSFFATESTKGFIWIVSAILLPGAGDALMRITPRDGEVHYENDDGDGESDSSNTPVKLALRDGSIDDDEEVDTSCSEDNKG